MGLKKSNFHHLRSCSYRNEVGILDINDAGPAGPEDIFGFGEAFVDGIPDNALREGQPFFIPRRHRGVGKTCRPEFYFKFSRV